MNKRIMNLVNFVRGVEPREPDKDLVLPVAEELRVNREFGLRSTVLFQYDALIRDDMTAFFRDGQAPDVECGLWFEMNRKLTEAVGIPWRGRPGYDWDWYVDPGFLPAYTPAQREQLIDTVFEKFYEVFGYYPKTAGSWLLDAHSMKYMSEKYALDALCICREQYAVDAYTLWGGYCTGGYYPSVNNALCPAAEPRDAIRTPVFRMLGLDPIYGYDENKYPTGVWGCNTMEPVWTSGSDRRVMNWYMDVYYKAPCLAFAHATTGQENSFGWPAIGPGYKLQAELIRGLADKGELSVETLGETGRAFKAEYAVTPCTALVALKDRTDNDLKAVWYNSPHYRAGLILEPGGRLYLRDLNYYNSAYCERYLREPCRSWDARYDVLPMVDNRLWSSPGSECALELVFDGTVTGIEVNEAGEEVLVVLPETETASDTADSSAVKRKELTVKAELRPDKLVFEGIKYLKYCIGMPENGQEISFDSDDNTFKFVHNGFAYKLKLDNCKVETVYSKRVETKTPDCAGTESDGVPEGSAAVAGNTAGAVYYIYPDGDAPVYLEPGR